MRNNSKKILFITGSRARGLIRPILNLMKKGPMSDIHWVVTTMHLSVLMAVHLKKLKEMVLKSITR
jgi:hypothetical protein